MLEYPLPHIQQHPCNSIGSQETGNHPHDETDNVNQQHECADDGKQLVNIESDSDITKIIGFTPDEKILLVDAENGTLQIWGSSE